jgi:uncharacterized LabA/DUF88 family protein
VSKNVAVFVDVANIFYAAKAAAVDIDYVTLLKSASAGRDLVRAYAYTGLDPDNENQRNFHDFLRRHGYRVVSKDIRKYGDGKVKANLDIELVVDMMKTARNLDIAIVVSGDGDFAPAIRAVQELGVRVEVISFRGNTSSDLIDVADQFTDITQLAKVERDSTRSGRRVADDEHDLSMTEVPDKLTEGAVPGRGRGGRGRGRGRAAEVLAGGRRGTPVPAPARPSTDLEPAGPVAPAAAAAGPGGASVVVLPGEKLSRMSAPTPAAAAELQEPEDEGALAAFGPERLVPAVEGDGGPAEGEGRRRRRRGGRGRGRGRGAGDGTEPYAEAASAGEDRAAGAYAPRPGGADAFGSVWDSQIGTPSRQVGAAPSDDEDYEEPAIPEYLLAERRQRGAGASRVGRGRAGRAGAYASFVERERFGRGGGGGINRYPDVSGRERPRDQVTPRADRARPAGDHDEPWSEVPPELEALLRNQLANRPRGQAPAPADTADVPAAAPRRDRGRRPARPDSTTPEAMTVLTPPSEAVHAETGGSDAQPSGPGASSLLPEAARRPRTRRGAAGSPATEPASPLAEPTKADRATPRRRTGTRTAAAGSGAGEAGEHPAAARAGTDAGEIAAPTPAPRRRRSDATSVVSTTAEAASAAAPRSRRRAAEASAGASPAGHDDTATPGSARPRRRSGGRAADVPPA